MIATHAHAQSLGWLGWLTTGLILIAIGAAAMGIASAVRRLLGRRGRGPSS